MDSKAKKTIFVDYQQDSKNYRLYDPGSRRIIISRDVAFDESSIQDNKSMRNEAKIYMKIPTTTQHQERESENESVQENDPSDTNDRERNADTSTEIEQAQRHTKLKTLRDRQSIRRPNRYESNYVHYNLPITFQEAVTGPDAEKWIDAVNDELRPHDKNKTWTIIPRTLNQETIDSKWVFKVSDDDNGKPHRFKARLCARGFLQDNHSFSEIFAPVVRYDTLSVISQNSRRRFRSNTIRHTYRVLVWRINRKHIHGNTGRIKVG